MNNLFQKLMLGGSTAALVASGTFTSALAQDDLSIEQVVVSGSRITIAGYEQPTPVTVVGIEQLERNAYANIADSINTLPQVNSRPSSYSASQGGFTAGTVGANTIDLRFLGPLRTLVLFDSQRVVQVGLQGGVDIGMLPSPVIMRVDIVTGGASAAWGSDAVAGVVNLVVNKNVNGFHATLESSSTYNGNVRGMSGNIAWGTDVFEGRGHVEFAVAANLNPDWALVTDQNWYRAAYWVSNPAFTPTNGQPQLIVASNVGLASATMGGIISSSPAGVAGPGVTAAPANALRGIQFVGNGIPQVVNYGNLTNNTISNGGSFGRRDSQASQATIASPNNSYTFFGYFRYKVTDAIQASIQLNAGYSSSAGVAGGALQTALSIKSDNAFIPASVRATMQAGGITSFTMGTFNANNYNNQAVTGETFGKNAYGALAPVTQFNRRVFTRSVFSLDGTLGPDWSWTAYIQHSQMRYTSRMVGNPISANLAAAQDAVTVTTANRGTSGLPLGSVVCRSSLPGQPAVVTGAPLNPVTAFPGCIPLNVFGEGVASPAAIAYITGGGAFPYKAHTKTQQDVAEVSMQGTLPWELPAGKIAVAFGAGWRKEGFWQVANAVAHAAGYANGNFTLYTPVHYTTMEGFAQVDVPVLKNNLVQSLDFSMAGRITDYSTSGMVETWKLGLTSQVTDDIKLRTTWSVDIRAPNLQELFNPGSVSQESLRDPKTQATVLSIKNSRGNRNLAPEVARTISGGVVLTPSFIPGLSVSADWYSIDLTGLIQTLASSAVVAQCNATLPSVIYPGTQGNPNDPLCSLLIFAGPNGALSGVNAQPINITSQTTSGLDLQANYSMDLWDGTLDLAGTANLNDENTISAPAQPRTDLAGTNNYNGGQNAPGPKWRGQVQATYSTGPYSFTVQGRWYGTAKYTNLANTGNLSTSALANLYDPAHFQVPAIAYLDLRGNYKWNDNIQFFGAIDNAMNVPPPLVPNTSANFTIGPPNILQTNISTYSMLGRTFRAGLRFNY